MSDDLRERVRALEVKTDNIKVRMDKFEIFCKETQGIYRESFADLNTRMEKFLNHEVHRLQDEIDEAKGLRREPMSRSDWVKLLGITIGVVGTVIVALIQYGIIG